MYIYIFIYNGKCIYIYIFIYNGKITQSALTQSALASERNSVVVDLNPTQNNFL